MARLAGSVLSNSIRAMVVDSGSKRPRDRNRDCNLVDCTREFQRTPSAGVRIALGVDFYRKRDS